MRIGILGAGYLGTRIAIELIGKHELWLTTTRSERVDELSPFAERVFVLEGSKAQAMREFLQPLDILFVTLAAKGSRDYKKTYQLTCQTIKELLENEAVSFGPRHIIYTSSTGVYGHHEGGWVDEASPLLTQTPQNLALIAAEKALIKLSSSPSKRFVTILRLAQLYGEDRPIEEFVHRLSGSTLSGQGAHYTNFTHIDDAASAALFAMNNALGGVYNVVAHTHIERRQFYNIVCQHNSWPAPMWDGSQSLSQFKNNRRVSSRKILAEGFEFIHPHILDWLDETELNRISEPKKHTTAHLQESSESDTSEDETV